MPKVLVIDNYDSFVYNLVQYLAELGANTIVKRNDEIKPGELEKVIEELKPSHILISPGPGRPSDAKISLDIIKNYVGKLPILGVCLGCQAIGEIFGGTIIYAPELMHGKTSEIHIVADHPIFHEIPSKYIATRYHSLVIDKESLKVAPDLALLACTEDGTVMAVAHKLFPSLVGVQYHPESILSEYGHKLLENFLSMR